VATSSETCAIAFKEWAGVCAALEQGVQSIVLRKGGIREGAGPGAFVPEHAEFWLYPTAVHQAQQGLRIAETGAGVPEDRPGGIIPIRALARVDLIGHVRDEARLSALRDLHVLTDDTVLRRFHYRSPGLWVLGVRIWRRDMPYEIIATPDQAGCKTWVMLDEPLPTSDLVAVLEDRAWAERLRRLKAILVDDSEDDFTTGGDLVQD
jgi:hypothetical protein